MKLKDFTVDDYLGGKTVLVDVDHLDECDHPLRHLSPEQVAHLLLSFHRNGLEIVMRCISLLVKPTKNKAHGQKTDRFHKGKMLPVLKQT